MNVYIYTRKDIVCLNLTTEIHFEENIKIRFLKPIALHSVIFNIKKYRY